MMSIGHAILGSAVYTEPLKGVRRGLCLSLLNVTFVHPVNGVMLSFSVKEQDYNRVFLAGEAKAAGEY